MAEDMKQNETTNQDLVKCLAYDVLILTNRLGLNPNEIPLNPNEIP